jgi:hypothetical protein
MKNSAVITLAFLLAALCTACAQDPGTPRLDSSSNLDPSPIAKRFGVPRCKVSVPLTQDQVLLAAERQGDPFTEKRPEWAKIKRDAKPGDQLRQVICITKGPQGYAAGDVFYGLFRDRVMIDEMHTIIIN